MSVSHTETRPTIPPHNIHTQSSNFTDTDRCHGNPFLQDGRPDTRSIGGVRGAKGRKMAGYGKQCGTCAKRRKNGCVDKTGERGTYLRGTPPLPSLPGMPPPCRAHTACSGSPRHAGGRAGVPMPAVPEIQWRRPQVRRDSVTVGYAQDVTLLQCAKCRQINDLHARVRYIHVRMLLLAGLTAGDGMV